MENENEEERLKAISQFPRPRIIVPVILYLAYFICFWLHLNVVADFLILKFPLVFERFYNFAFQYSSQLKSTYLMLLASISSIMFLLTLLLRYFKGILKDSPEIRFLKLERKHMIGIASLVFIYLTYYALQRHNTFHSKAWDLAIFAQLIDNFRHGVFFEAKIRGVENIFSDHFTPIIYLFTPLLYIWNDPSRLLLVVQAVFITFGALPVFLITRERTKSQRTGYLIAVVYLLLPTLQFMNIFDFHPAVLSIPLMLFAWYFWEIRRFPMMYLFLALTMLCHEQMWIVVGSLGLYLALFERQRLRGILITIIGWGGFLFLILYFFPLFRGGEEYFYIHRYAYLGDSLQEILQSIMTKPMLWIPRLVSPHAIMFIILMLLPVGFLPLFRPKYLLILLPTYFYSALSIETLQVSIFAQYAAPYVPFLIIALIYGLCGTERNHQSNLYNTSTTHTLALFSLCAVLLTNFYFSPYTHGRAYQKEQFAFDGRFSSVPGSVKRSIKKKNKVLIAEELSTEVSISVQSWLAPHIISRDLFLFPDGANADIVILDLAELKETDIAATKALFNRKDYQITNGIDSVMGFKKIEGDHEMSLYEEMALANRLKQNELNEVVYDSDYIARTIISAKKSPESKLPLPLIMETALYEENFGHFDYMTGEFKKMVDTKQSFFGVFLFPIEKTKNYFYGSPPNIQVVKFWKELLYREGWQVGESHKYYVRYPYSISKFSPMHKKLPIFLLFEIPENYPNTLEEYFTEMYIQNRWQGRIFTDPNLPQNGYKDKFEFTSDSGN